MIKIPVVLNGEDFTKNLQSPSQTALRIFREYFTMHLLKSEVDLRYIQGLPGQNISKTTEIHTYVIKISLIKTKNPIDNVVEGLA